MSMNAKLALGAAVIVAVLVYVVYLGAAGSWQYYVLVDECAGQADQFRGKRLRVSGSVAARSLRISVDRRAASFVLQGNEHCLPVTCLGTLPDNLAEGMDVVVEGALRPDGHLQGDKVITRCASKYAPAGASHPAGEATKASSAL